MPEYLANWVQTVPDRFYRRRYGRRRLGRLEDTDRQGRQKIQLVGDDLFVTNVKRCSRESIEGIGKFDSDQSEPDRYADRNHGSDRAWPGVMATPP